MAVSELNWKRKEYETWDEAFRGLAPAVRQQSVRVAAYTQVLFVQACADSFGRWDEEAAERIRGQNADLAYKCGLYHQLGKALVPPEYQILRQDFTEEELAVYRKYTTDGRQLAAALQERSARARDKRRGTLGEQPTRNIPWLMIRESCQQHMERWDGSGYPEGRRGREISPIAQIVGLARELDRLASETKSETPFEDAIKALRAGENTAWSPELLRVLKNAEPRCREVYEKYIHYTMTLPATIPLVEKREDRPMGLQFRPMTSDVKGTVAAYEALPWFGGIAGRPGETEEAADLEPMLHRTGLTADISRYFLYEAADAVLRMNNCSLAARTVVLQMLPDFWQLNSQLQMLEQLFRDQPIGKEQLLLTVPEATVLSAGKGRLETLQRYLRNGFSLLLDGYHPDRLSAERLKELGFTLLRLSPEENGKPETAAAMAELRAGGFTLIGAGADEHETLAWLAENGAAYMSGTLTGRPVSEDELIRDALLPERGE